ncbi:MAG: peptidase S8, partial [Bacteroidetes bacterium]
MKIRILVWLMSGLLLPLTAWTQSADKAPDNWHHLDSRQDGFNGISTEQMYQFLKGRTPQTVVVAVIDSGVDCEHEDLQDVIWVNEDEIPDNGRDDDGNGYVDDVHGWNFIGGKDGKNVHFDQLELTRLYVHYRKKFEGKDPETLKKKERKEYERYKDLEKKLHEKQEEMKGNV